MLSVSLIGSNASIYARPHSIVGVSGALRAQLEVPSNLMSALMTKIRGGPFFMHKLQLASTDNTSGSNNCNVLLAPNSAGVADVVAVDVARLSHSASLVISQSDSFLACSSNVSFKPYGIWSSHLHCYPSPNSLNTSDKGSGEMGESNGSMVAICAPGVISSLQLKQGEEYFVSRSHLVAYSSTSEPSQLFDFQPAVSPNWFLQDQQNPHRTPNLLHILKGWTVLRLRQMFVRPVLRLRHWITGDVDLLVKLSGPGEFWISSRSRPSIPSLANLTNSVSQLRYQGRLLRESRKLALEQPVDEQPAIVKSVSTVETLQNRQVVTVDANGKVLFGAVQQQPVTDKEPQPQKEQKKKQSWKALLFGSKQQ